MSPQQTKSPSLQTRSLVVKVFSSIGISGGYTGICRGLGVLRFYWAILGLHRGNGNENGNDYPGFRVER